MYDLISIGNVSIDVYYKGKSLTHNGERFQLAIGGKYFCEFFSIEVGGGGANVAIGLANFGYNVALLSRICDNFFTKIVLDRLKEKKVSTEYCAIEKNYFNISTVLLSETGEKTIINYRTQENGFLNNPEHIKQLMNTKAVYMGNLADVELSIREKALKLLKDKGIMTIVNLGVKDCRQPTEEIIKLLENVEILIINAHEFADVVKQLYKDIDFKKNLIQKYPFLKNKIVILTDGEKGSYGYTNEKVYFQEPVKVNKIVDATGAGDGYTAGFIAEYLKSKDISKAMANGAQYAVKILTKIGAN